MKRLILIALIPVLVGCTGMTKQQNQLLGGIVGAAAGSLFVFKGKYRAVLINYPNQYDKEEIVRLGNLN